MRDKKIECYRLLKRYSDYLNKQQYSTFKGQIQAGDIDGFYKGIKLVVNRNRGWKTQEWGRHYRQYYTASPGAHPGSYNGQDAYNDMFITERMSSVDKLGWSANRSNTNDEQCGRRATDAGQRKL